MIITHRLGFGQLGFVKRVKGLKAHGGRVFNDPRFAGHAAGSPPLFARGGWGVLANVSRAQINEPKLARPAAQAKCGTPQIAVYVAHGMRHRAFTPQRGGTRLEAARVGSAASPCIAPVKVVCSHVDSQESAL